MIAENKFTNVDIFEQRNAFGGVWNYTSDNDARGAFAIPQTDPQQPLDIPIWRHTSDARSPDRQAPTFVSPMYDRLEANLPKKLMQYSDTSFPECDQLFPTHTAITRYLRHYAEGVKHCVTFERQVFSLEKNESWKLMSRDLRSRKEYEDRYDAVIVASGHYNIPFIPDMSGLKDWSERYPGIISHSKLYRRPEDYRDKVRTLLHRTITTSHPTKTV